MYVCSVWHTIHASSARILTMVANERAKMKTRLIKINRKWYIVWRRRFNSHCTISFLFVLRLSQSPYSSIQVNLSAVAAQMCLSSVKLMAQNSCMLIDNDLSKWCILIVDSHKSPCIFIMAQLNCCCVILVFLCSIFVIFHSEWKCQFCCNLSSMFVMCVFESSHFFKKHGYESSRQLQCFLV